VVLLSSVSEGHHDLQGQQAGVEASLTKPVRRSHLHACLLRLRGEQGGADGRCGCIHFGCNNLGLVTIETMSANRLSKM